MIQLNYIRYVDSYEQFCVDLYNSLSKHNIQNVHIVEHNKLTTSQKKFISQFCNPEFITPDRFLALHQQCAYPINIKTDEIRSDAPVVQADVAIVVYIYYTMYLREICSYINRYRQQVSADVYFYICDKSASDDIESQIQEHMESSTGVHHEFVPNNGRDIRSFLQFVKDKKFIKYKHVCKIHGKKTTYLHEKWREEYCKSLLDSYSFNANILNNTKNDIFPVDKFSIIEKYNPRSVNYISMNNLSKMMGLTIPSNMRIKYNAGTMFWCTNRYCDRLFNFLKNIDIETLFEPEPIALDGTMSHAWERVFWVL